MFCTETAFSIFLLCYVWVFGNLRGREGIWGCFGGSITKIPPYLPLTPAIPREPYVFIVEM
jgi:hypothetical protein